MSIASAAYAHAAKDAYRDRSEADIGKVVILHGHKYRVFASESYTSGFHGTAYRQVESPYALVIAYRGTDTDFRNHTLTGVQDVAVDTIMVADRINPQEADACRFTQAVLEKAARQGIPRDLVTVTGHSMGGTLAQIEAWRFGLRGETFNAYGAVELGIGVPEGGGQLIDNVLAGDPVSACSRHFGQVRAYATPADVAGLREAGYLGDRHGLGRAFAALRAGDHGIDNFAPDHGPSVLTAANAARAVRYADAIAAFRQDAWAARVGLQASTRVPVSATWHLARATEVIEAGSMAALHLRAEVGQLGHAVAQQAGRAWDAARGPRNAVAQVLADAWRQVERRGSGRSFGRAAPPPRGHGTPAPVPGAFPAPASGVAAPWVPVVPDTPLLGGRDHPASPLYAQALTAVTRMEARHGLPGGPHSARLAGALVVEALREGLQRIDHAEPSADRARVVAIQGDRHGPYRRLVAVDTVLAAGTPLERSSAVALAPREPAMHEAAPRDCPAIAPVPVR